MVHTFMVFLLCWLWYISTIHVEQQWADICEFDWNVSTPVGWIGTFVDPSILYIGDLNVCAPNTLFNDQLSLKLTPKLQLYFAFSPYNMIWWYIATLYINMLAYQRKRLAQNHTDVTQMSSGSATYAPYCYILVFIT